VSGGRDQPSLQGCITLKQFLFFESLHQPWRMYMYTAFTDSFNLSVATVTLFINMTVSGFVFFSISLVISCRRKSRPVFLFSLFLMRRRFKYFCLIAQRENDRRQWLLFSAQLKVNLLEVQREISSFFLDFYVKLSYT
jgi:hypothetical protein